MREALDGGQIISVNVPSKNDAAKMLLGTAGLDVEALQSRDEVARVVDMCKQLPLTIGVAGKVVRQLANGSSMAAASDWTDVIDVLEEEFDDAEAGRKPSLATENLLEDTDGLRPPPFYLDAVALCFC